MVSTEKYQKLKETAISLVPGGQYYLAKKKGKSDEELKWYKRLEYSRAALLGEAAVAAAIGDYPAAVGDAAAYALASLPANSKKPDEGEYEREKERLATEKGTVGMIRRGWHEVKTRVGDAVADPEVATYVALALAANGLAATGGEKMLYKTFEPIDTVPHFAGGFSYSKLADKLYERGNVADRLKEKLEKIADGMDEKKSKLHSAAKYVVRKMAEHPKETLGIGTIAAAGTVNELFEKTGDAVAKSAAGKAFFGETTYNSVKDWFVNMAGSLSHYYYSKNKKPVGNENEGRQE